MDAKCSRGWSRRCAQSAGTRCTCRCGGARHGSDRREVQLSMFVRRRWVTPRRVEFPAWVYAEALEQFLDRKYGEDVTALDAAVAAFEGGVR